jgi:hypothetical protein
MSAKAEQVERTAMRRCPEWRRIFPFSPGSKTEDVSEYLAELCLDCVELGYTKLCIILDNNPTHKQRCKLS